MAPTFKYLIFSILFLTLANKGSSYCSLKNLVIGTTRSGRLINGVPESNVNVVNNCASPQCKIRLNCRGFQSVESVNPSILLKEASGTCLLINGNPLRGFTNVSFSYAWDPPYVFFPSTSNINQCQ